MGSTKSDSKTNSNQLADRIDQTKQAMNQLQGLINDETSDKLLTEHQQKATELEELKTEIGLQTTQQQTLLASKAEKTQQLQDLAPANELEIKKILPEIRATKKNLPMELPAEDMLLQDTDAAIALIDPICAQLVENNPLEKPQIYQEKLNLLNKVKTELEKEVRTKADVKLILQAIDEFPELKIKSSNSPGGFIHFLKLIKRNTDAWVDFQARHRNTFRTDPSPEEYKDLVNPLLKAITSENSDLIDFLSASRKNEENISTCNTARQNLLQIKAALVSNKDSKTRLEAELTALEDNLSKQAETLSNLAIESEQKSNEKEALKTQIQAITDAGNEILDELLAIFNSQPKLTHAENKAAQETNAGILTTINEALETLPADDELQQLVDLVTPFDETKSMSAKFTNYLEAKKNAGEQLETNKLANERLLARIDHREGLVINFRQKLESYLETRNRRYVLNDAILSIDGKYRTAFINVLFDKLDAYHASGNAQPVIRFISGNIDKFPGNNLQAILNKLTIELLDFDKQIPENFTDLPAAAEDTTNLHTDAAGLLLTLGDDRNEYVQNINNLYERIAHMREYGEKLDTEGNTCGIDVSKLADQLQTDVDHFVLAHKDASPNKASYTSFKTQFTARLHSQDDEMSKHREAWKPILANICIGIVSLGIAIGFKLIISKLSTGRASLFFDETARQEKIQSIDKSLQTLAAPAV